LNKVFQYIISERVKSKLKNKRVSEKEFKKEFKSISVEFSHILHDAFFMVVGALAAGFGLNGFLLPNMFIDGGVTGISLIISELTGFSLAILLILINTPFLLLGFSTIGKQFAIKSIIAIFMLAAVVHFVSFPVMTEDKLLIAIFGGFFLGLGIGLAIRGGSVIDGTEVLAVFISRKTSLTIGDIILLFNIIIFGFAAYVFTIEVSMYAMLTYLAASKTVDFVVSGIEEYMGVTIISDESEEIRLAIIEKLGRGCTIYKGKRGFGKRGDQLDETDIIYTLLTRLELARLQKEIDLIDKNAFVVMHSIKDVRGGMIKKRPLE
jgi:uncharacterized membrane-anchored protein YitT (DUF2179 family)